MHYKHKFILGCAQFSEKYGVSAPDMGIRLDEKRLILELAEKHGITELDTAHGYGLSEKVLGDLGVKNFKVNTKLPISFEFGVEASKLVNNWFSGTLKKLNTESLNNIFFHRPEQLLTTLGSKVYSELILLRESGHINGVGVSVNDPKELEILLEHYDFDIVQLPFNVFDDRFSAPNIIQSLKQKSVIVQARSLFLQGVLLQPFSKLPDYFSTWEPHWRKYEMAINQTGYERMRYCLSLVSKAEFIDECVIGCQSARELNHIIKTSKEHMGNVNAVSSSDTNLICPSNWKLS